MTDDLTTHPNVGVRWQAQMEDFLSLARERMNAAARISVATSEGKEAAAVHAQVAQAAATAALALAIANTGGDVAEAISNVPQVYRDGHPS